MVRIGSGMKPLAVIIGVWLAASATFGVLWALCGMAYDRRERALEAERLDREQFELVWGW